MNLIKLTRFRATRKLAIVSGILLISLIVITAINLHNINDAQEKMNQMVNDINVKVAVVGSMEDMIKDVQIYIRNIALDTDMRQMQDELRKLQTARNMYDESESRLEKLFVSDEDKTQLARMKELRMAVRPIADHAIELGLQNKDQEANALITQQVEPMTKRRLVVIQEVVEQQKKAGQKAAEEIMTAQEHARVLTLVLGFLALVLGMVVAFVAMIFALGMDGAGSSAGREM